MLLTLHLTILGITIIGILLADHEGFLWMRGKRETLSSKRVRIYHWWVWLGLAGMIATGFSMFWPLRELLLNNPVFIVKMMAVLILVINGFAIGELNRLATTRPFSSLTLKEKTPLYISGALSTGCWGLAIILGFFIF